MFTAASLTARRYLFSKHTLRLATLSFAYYTTTKFQPHRTPSFLAFSPPTTHCEGTEADRPYLGCSLRSMMDKAGMMILLVNTESPAWHAGLKVGDILLEIDGLKINNISDYYGAVASGKKRLLFKVVRNGDERLFEVNFN